ncbi:MAG: nucleoside phosphorylase [Clostridia bacterium]|nr:nucleoside phosphorylase [Clostridia bacterium]
MILEEFDNSKKAVIDAAMIKSVVPDFPQTSIACFSVKLFDRVLEAVPHKQIGDVGCANGKAPVYEVEYGGKRFSFFMASVGEPACVGEYEDMIAMGSRRLILFGNCGVLDKNIEDCGIIIPTAAIRDEGCSYHYAPPSDLIKVNKKYVPEFKQVLKECGYGYTEGITWTTDAVYRETADKVRRRREQGAICVEMECAGMQAMCDFRGVEFFQFFYAGDNLDHDQWQPRSLSGSVRIDDKLKIAFLAFELGIRIS